MDKLNSRLDCACICGAKLIKSIIKEMLRCHRMCGKMLVLPCCYVPKPNQYTEFFFIVGISAPIVAALYPGRIPKSK